MKKQPQDQSSPKKADDQNENFNANSAYSGSGSMQPGGSTGEAGKLNDSPNGDLDENLREVSKNKTNTPIDKIFEQGLSQNEDSDSSKDNGKG
jgi:hypothetical protein